MRHGRVDETYRKIGLKRSQNKQRGDDPGDQKPDQENKDAPQIKTQFDEIIALTARASSE